MNNEEIDQMSMFGDPEPEPEPVDDGLDWERAMEESKPEETAPTEAELNDDEAFLQAIDDATTEFILLGEDDLALASDSFVPGEDRLEPVEDPVRVNEYIDPDFSERLNKFTPAIQSPEVIRPTAELWNSDTENPLADIHRAAEALAADSGVPADIIADQLADEGFHEHDFMGPGDTCSQYTPEPAPLATDPVFDKPMTLEQLQEAAQRALAVIEEEKRLKKIAKYRERAAIGADIRHPVNNHLYTQAKIIEGGCGLEGCSLCLGEACRFCGWGCWDDTVKEPCEHTIQERHVWDEEKTEYRKNLLNEELLSKGMTSEIRRQEMLDKIFDGEPMKEGAQNCFKCHKRIEMGSLAVITSRGSYHLACPVGSEPDPIPEDDRPLTEEDIPF